MPFCSQCGNPVSDAAALCPGCGAPQPVGTVPEAAEGRLFNLSRRQASVLCYAPWLGWIACVAVLASAQFRRDRAIRFHAFQGMYLFVAYLMDDVALRPLDHFMGSLAPLTRLFELVLVAVSIYMMVKTAHGVVYSLPLAGDLAQRSAAE